MNEDTLLKAAERAVYESITKALANEYNGPIKKAVDAVLTKHEDKVNNLVEEAFLSCLNAENFKQSVQSAMNDKLARNLVSALGGELERRVNELKADPATRAKITLALTEMVS